MNDVEALVTLLQAFPGTRVEPHMHTGDYLDGCEMCGVSTILRDDAGVPWHLHCKRRSIGLE